MKSNVDGNHGLVTVEVEPKAVHHLAISPRFHKNWAVCCRWKDPASPMQDSFSGQTRLIFAILSHSSSHRCKSSNWRWYHPSSNPTFQSFEFACIKMLGKSEPKQNILPTFRGFFHGDEFPMVQIRRKITQNKTNPRIWRKKSIACCQSHLGSAATNPLNITRFIFNRCCSVFTLGQGWILLWLAHQLQPFPDVSPQTK